MLPKTLKNFNLFIEGESYAGRIEELTLPKLSRKMEKYRGGGLNGDIEIDLGMEKLEMEFTLREYSREVLNQWGVYSVMAMEPKGASRIFMALFKPVMGWYVKRLAKGLVKYVLANP